MDLSLEDLIKKNKKSKPVGPRKKWESKILSNNAFGGSKTHLNCLKFIDQSSQHWHLPILSFIFRLSSSPGKPIRKPLVKGGKPGKAGGKPLPKAGSTVFDARLKIIKKNRVKIHDARERIAENARKTIKDARELITSKKPILGAQRLKKGPIPRGRPVPRGPKPQPADFMMDEDFDIDELVGKPVGSLKRTVRNDMFRTAPLSMPKMPTFSINQEMLRISPDPFDCYVVPKRHHIPIPPIRPERVERYQPGRIMSAHMDAYEPKKSILRSSQLDDHDDRFENDRYMPSSSDGVRNRLYNESRNNDRNESAGIFAKLPVRGSSPPPAQHGHRIIISNLHTSVTENDVRELFEDVGPLGSAKLVRPGIAEVVYKSLGDAEEAVETYHNRQLDGMPMKCMLVRSNGKPSYSRF